MGVRKETLRIGGKPILTWLLERIEWPGPTILVTAPGHDHPPGTPADHHDTAEEAAQPRVPATDREAAEPAAAPQPESVAEPTMVEHRHADGTVESHPVAPAEPTESNEPADDGHDHQH